MDKKIEKILEDIYDIDESMRAREAEIAKIVEELIKSKPIAKIDDDFVRRLRSELLLRASGKENKIAAQSGFSMFGAGSKLVYSFMGAMIAVILLVPIFFYRADLSPRRFATEEGNNERTALNPSVTKISDNAFGSFLPGDIQKAGPSGLGVGGGGGAATSGNATGDAAQKQAGMPIYETTNYRYVYKGQEITSLSDNVEVYARVKNDALRRDLAETFIGANMALLDMNKFENLNVNNVSFSEDRDFGYEVNLSPLDGSTNIYMNWMKWPDPYAPCAEAGCPESIYLKLADIPEDAEILSIADGFLETYGIDRSSYGEGSVLRNFLDQYPRPLEAQTDIFIPDSISVLYPLKIDGKNVYDSSGEPDGIFVDVSIRYKKVSGARNIYYQNFQSSGYAAETDAKNIIAYAEKGGLYGDYVYENATKTQDIELGDPSLDLVKIWRYNNDKRMGEEFYVPSFIFPILKKPEGFFYRKNVIVPVIKEMLSDASGAGPFIK